MSVDKRDRVLSEIENISIREQLPIIGPVKGEVLAEVLRKKNPKRVLEVGTLVGYSAILMAKNLGKDGKVTSIEINPIFAKIAIENIKRAGFEDKIRVVFGDALGVLPRISGPFSAKSQSRQLGGPAKMDFKAFGWDFVFIDAAKEEYLDYLKLIEDKLSSGAVVVADNAKIFAQAVADYLSYVRNSSRYQSQFIDCGEDGLEVSILA